MARQRGVDGQLELTQGFVTEANPVTFPQTAAVDIDNCIIDKDRSTRRRPGVDLEQQWLANSINGGVFAAADIANSAFATSLWEFVSNSGTLDIIVQQVGVVLQMYAQFGAVSRNLLGEVDLTPYAVDAAELRGSQVQTASGLGNLYVVHPYMEPIKISYDGTTFTVEQIDIRVRDFEGLEDNLEIDERPTVLLRNHYYNLKNQGWSDENLLVFAGLPASTNICSGTGDVGGLLADSGKDWPSNADVMHVGLVTNGDGNLEFDASFVREGFTGNTPAAKGHYIFDAFSWDYDTVTGCPGTGSKIIPTRPESVVFHQGRAFYTVPNLQNQIGGVFYSQQLTLENKDGNAFQEADPTADQVNELVATDGGFLPMPGVGEIYALKEMGNGIAVIASNGVWRISGAEIGSAISATNISLSKVTRSGALGASSIVEVEGTFFFFGIEGIIQLQANETGFTATNVTQNSIQDFYISINAETRREAAGVYVPEQRKVYWAYREAFANVTPTVRSFNKFLILDFDVQGFYKYSIGNDASQNFPEIVGLSLVKPLTAQTGEINVVDNLGNIVTTEAGDPVTVEATTNVGQITQLKLATLVYVSGDSGYKMTFSTFHSRSFTDWRDFDVNGSGIPMTSFVDYAQQAMSAPHVKGTPTWVHTFYQKTSKNLEPGGYYELPPLYYPSTGVRISQSVLEILNKPSSNLRVSQTVLEAIYDQPADLQAYMGHTEVMIRFTDSGSPIAQDYVGDVVFTDSFYLRGIDLGTKWEKPASIIEPTFMPRNDADNALNGKIQGVEMGQGTLGQMEAIMPDSGITALQIGMELGYKPQGVSAGYSPALDFYDELGVRIARVSFTRDRNTEVQRANIYVGTSATPLSSRGITFPKTGANRVEIKVGVSPTFGYIGYTGFGDTHLESLLTLDHTRIHRIVHTREVQTADKLQFNSFYASDISGAGWLNNTYYEFWDIVDNRDDENFSFGMISAADSDSGFEDTAFYYTGNSSAEFAAGAVPGSFLRTDTSLPTIDTAPIPSVDGYEIEGIGVYVMQSRAGTEPITVDSELIVGSSTVSSTHSAPTVQKFVGFATTINPDTSVKWTAADANTGWVWGTQIISRGV